MAGRLPALAVVGALCAACGNGHGPPIDRLEVAAVAESVLVARLSWEVREATCAELVVRRADGTEELLRRQLDAREAASGGTNVVGLDAETHFEAVLTAWKPTGVTTLEARWLTAPLPDSLARVQLAVTGLPPSGFVLMDLLDLSDPAAVVAFDGRGRIRWYRLFQTGGVTFEAKQLVNGDFTVFVYGLGGTTDAFVELTPGGTEVRRIAAPAPYRTDDHELLVTQPGTPAERFHLLSTEVRSIEWPGLGVLPTLGHRIHRLCPDGTEEWSWSAWDHVEAAEATNVIVVDGARDLDHPNAIDIGVDGNYLVSFRDLDAVFLIDATSGEVQWRLGGARSDFAFVGDPAGGIRGQHMARWLPNGHLLLFDNGSGRGWSRAAEYALDLGARTASLVWEGRHSPDVNALFLGSTERTGQGTLVGYGWVGLVDLVGADGQVTWEGQLLIDGRPTRFYRAVPVPSLAEYRPP
jgi:hypothetical protein